MCLSTGHSGGVEQTIFSTDELFARGLGPKEIRAMIGRGVLTRLRKGWYADLGAADSDAAVALKAGAHLGCLSGCKAHGIWVPPSSGVHAAYGRGASTKARTGLVLHPYKAKQPRTAIWPVEDCLAQVIERHDAETILIVVESAVSAKVIPHEMAEQMLKQTPIGDLTRWLSRARSGSETRVRLFFQRRHVPVHPLATVLGVGEVDMVVGDRLLVECDSERHHGSPEAQLNDSLRDLNGHLLDYQRIRLTYDQIWHDWAATQVSLSAVLRKRRHIHRLRPSRATTPEGRSRAAVLAERHTQRRRMHSLGFDEDLRDFL